MLDFLGGYDILDTSAPTNDHLADVVTTWRTTMSNTKKLIEPFSVPYLSKETVTVDLGRLSQEQLNELVRYAVTKKLQDAANSRVKKDGRSKTKDAITKKAKAFERGVFAMFGGSGGLTPDQQTAKALMGHKTNKETLAAWEKLSADKASMDIIRTLTEARQQLNKRMDKVAVSG